MYENSYKWKMEKTPQPIEILKQFSDKDQNSVNVIKRSSDLVESFLSSRGYVSIDTPIIEKTELFIRKASGDISSQLYTFEDPEGVLVSLRPDFTASVIRSLGNKRLLNDKDSLKVCYSGPVFRFFNDDSNFRQFNQVGCEFFGSKSTKADSEVIDLASGSIEKLGLKDIEIRVGHIGVLLDLLSHFDLPSRSKLFLINEFRLVDKSYGLEEILNKAKSQNLLNGNLNFLNELEISVNKTNDIKKIKQELTMNLEKKIDGPLGSRSIEDIRERIIEKIISRTSFEDFNEATIALLGLIELNGSLEKLNKYFKSRNIKTDQLERLENIIEGVSQKDSIVIDLNVTRNLAYYNGMVFDIFYENFDKSITIGGGGRYDELPNNLGYQFNSGALGFAFNIDLISELIEKK
ncbi:MAG: hypothetical protein CL764_06175 [Chloroflexi bacterium]|nr:hypothetical protein [Chloroflexota bacterium]|tara:strand:- start:325 stop:1542 length:1218 start_codon:yes stop_codon:yes gene_type:complete